MVGSIRSAINRNGRKNIKQQEEFNF
ncbi:YrzO family protein [Bacillus mojavensis]|nr:YrzO family protein [Bacillus mojavensis]MEC1735253.1 YrzO family protein [Bacillus mojavensis]MED1008599.1 YrzO family protein [Bacillus mojavensis]